MYKNEHKRKVNFDYILKECKKRFTPFGKKVERDREPIDIIKSIKNVNKSGRNVIISEVKYRSPSKKNQITKNPEAIAKEMIKGGACAISVLTENKFFGGSLKNLKKVKSVSPLPVLRKDFIFHPTQIPESYYWGADSILLISSFFTENELRAMIEGSRSYGMEPLVEVHNPEDIVKSSEAGGMVFGINNRDKDTLEIDLNRTAEMAPLIRGVKVSASGIETTTQLKEILRYTDAALIGSSIMNSEDIATKVAEFVRF
jgi:indole-3-glycerol phosphate synthase